jgi:glycosyltransferase involved in cell wall biosynthesis
MRILHIIGTISPAAGGPTEVVRMLVRHAPAGASTEVATLDDPAAPFLRNFPCTVHALGTNPPRWHVPALRRWLETNRNRFDAAIVHGLWEYTGLAARRALAGHIPYAIFPHGMLDPWFKHTYPSKHLKKYAYWLAVEYWNLRRASHVLFTTQTEATLAQQSFTPWSWNSAIAPIGAEAPPQDTGRLLEAFYNHCPSLRGKNFLLFLGRIDPKKGCDLLISAYAGLVQEGSSLHLVMAGPDPGDWKKSLRNGSEEFEQRIHWPGMLTGDAKYGALAACEAFILPSHQENFGVAVVEALAAGKPVLISDKVNIAPEIAADGCGLVEPDTLEGTRALLTRFLALSPTQREAMSSQAHLTFAARYDMRQNAARILRIFDPAAPAETPIAAPIGDLR